MIAVQGMEVLRLQADAGWSSRSNPPAPQRVPAEAGRPTAPLAWLPGEVRVTVSAEVAAPGPGRAVLAINVGSAVPVVEPAARAILDREFAPSAALCLWGDGPPLALGRPTSLLLIETAAKGILGENAGANGAGRTRPSVPVALRPDELMGGLAATLSDEIVRTPQRDPALQGMLACSLIVRASHLLQEVTVDEQEVRPTRIPAFKLRRIQKHVDDNIGERITLDDLASIAGVSRFHFARAFKAETGTSPMQYVMGRRLGRCRELIAETDLSLAEIALSCGFASQSHMTTAFRGALGTTPGQYRRAHHRA